MALDDAVSSTDAPGDPAQVRPLTYRLFEAYVERSGLNCEINDHFAGLRRTTVGIAVLRFVLAAVLFF